MSTEKQKSFPLIRIIVSLFLLFCISILCRIILIKIPGETSRILYFFAPMLFGHFFPLIFIGYSKNWSPIDKWLPKFLHCGTDRTIQGIILIFSGALALYLIRYLFFCFEIWRDLELKVKTGEFLLQLPFTIFLIITVIIFSIIADLISHLIEKKIDFLFMKKVIAWSLWHIDSLTGAIGGLYLWCYLTGFSLKANNIDLILSLIVFLFIHIAVDRIIHWNSKIGLKYFADKQ